MYGHCAGQKKGSLPAVCTFFLAGCLAECSGRKRPIASEKDSLADSWTIFNALRLKGPASASRSSWRSQSCSRSYLSVLCFEYLSVLRSGFRRVHAIDWDQTPKGERPADKGPPMIA